MWWNSYCNLSQVVTTLKLWQNSNCEKKTQQLKKWTNSKWDKTQKLKLWQNLKYDKHQFKKIKTLTGSLSKNMMTPWQLMRCSLGSVLQFLRCFWYQYLDIIKLYYFQLNFLFQCTIAKTIFFGCNFKTVLFYCSTKNPMLVAMHFAMCILLHTDILALYNT